ncbi:hypothetical protein BH24ACT3_BH24ACT3_16720 [soil metagenome]
MSFSARPLVAAVAATSVAVLPTFLAGALGVQLRADLGFGEAGLGLAVGAFFASGALASAVLGRSAERLGAARSLRGAALWSAAVQLGIAGLARSAVSLTALLALAGAANALAQPAGNLFVARELPPSRQGMAFGVKQSAIPVATLLGGLAVPTVALTVGWRWAFVIGAALALGAAALVPAAPPSATATTTTRPRRRGRAAGDTPLAPLVVLGVGVGLGAAAAGTLAAFLVSSGVEAGLDERLAGLALTLGSAMGITVRLVAGFRADRRTGGHLRVVAAMLALGTGGYLLLATGAPVAHLLATPLAFGAGWAWPGLFNLAVVRANPGSPAAATGITQTGTYIGAVAGPLLFGAVAARWSYEAAWTSSAVLSLSGAVGMLAGRSLLRRSRLQLIA